MTVTDFPDIKRTRMRELAFDKLQEYVNECYDSGLETIEVIGIIELYKQELIWSLSADEEDE
jgi:phosphosulfolactate synthase (CoM biosynthesis protein A)